MQAIFRVVIFGLLLVPLCGSVVSAEQVCKPEIIATSAEVDFSLSNDGTVVSNTTGLMWLRCSLGQKWDGQTCSGTAELFSWSEALKATVGYAFAGQQNWRLPNKNELESIVELRCSSPSINSKVFPATPATYFWSSSPYTGVTNAAWSVDFAYGSVNASVKTGNFPVRLVRGFE